MTNKKDNPLIILAICSMLSAMSFVLMLLEFPVTPPAMGHLKMDFSDIPALFVGVIFGPVYSVIVELVKNLLELVFKGMGTQMGFGNLMNFIVGCAYIVPFSLVLRRKKEKMKEKSMDSFIPMRINVTKPEPYFMILISKQILI